MLLSTDYDLSAMFFTGRLAQNGRIVLADRVSACGEFYREPDLKLLRRAVERKGKPDVDEETMVRLIVIMAGLFGDCGPFANRRSFVSGRSFILEVGAYLPSVLRGMFEVLVRPENATDNERKLFLNSDELAPMPMDRTEADRMVRHVSTLNLI